MPTVFSTRVTGFIEGTLVPKLRRDIEDLRVFNRRDMQAAAYHHLLKFVGMMPGWSIRCEPEAGARRPDLAVVHNQELVALLLFGMEVLPGQDNYFPMSKLDEQMNHLRESVSQLGKGKAKGYYLVAFDTTDAWYYPSAKMMERQSCFLLPLNIREVHNHKDWRAKWDKLKQSPF